MKRNKTAGISLVALVVTIIVLIILTGAVVVTFMDGGIIDRAKESVFKNDMRSYQEQLVILKAQDQIAISTNQKDYEPVVMKENALTEAEIKEAIPEFNYAKYGELVQIVNGELVAAKELSEDVLEEKWLLDLGFGETALDEETWDNSYEALLVISNDGVLSGFNEEEMTYDEDGTYFTIPEEYSDLIIPDTVTSINYGAFSYCSNLNSVKIPGSVKSIGSNAFENCPSLTSVTMEKGVEIIEDQAFYYCSSLTSVTLSEGIETIGIEAFAECALTSIIIPEGVKSIGEFAFSPCPLTSLSIPESVNNIGLSVFYGHAGLTDINYKGTKAQWNAIGKEEGWIAIFEPCTVHCTDGDIVLESNQ